MMYENRTFLKGSYVGKKFGRRYFSRFSSFIFPLRGSFLLKQIRSANLGVLWGFHPIVQHAKGANGKCKRLDLRELRPRAVFSFSFSFDSHRSRQCPRSNLSSFLPLICIIFFFSRRALRKKGQLLAV